jgi:hypothetical protein
VTACKLEAALAYDKGMRALQHHFPDDARLKRVKFPAAGEQLCKPSARGRASKRAAGEQPALHQRKEDEGVPSSPPLYKMKKMRFAAPETAAPHEALHGAPTAPPGFALAAASPEAAMTPPIVKASAVDSDDGEASPMQVAQPEAPASAAAAAADAAAFGAAVPSAAAPPLAAPPVAMTAAALPAALAAARAEARAAQSAARAAAATERAAQEKVEALERCEAAFAAKAATEAAKAAKAAELDAARTAFDVKSAARQALLEKAASIQAELEQTRREAEAIGTTLGAANARAIAAQRADAEAAAADSAAADVVAAAADAVADSLRAVGGPAVLPQ